MKENAADRLRTILEDTISDRKRLIRIMLIILILLAAVILRIHENNESDITIEDISSSSSGEICVDIGGAVAKPGVYTVDADTRLYEVIEMAGGLLSNADTDSINRAEYVEDGEKIIIPSRTVPAGSAASAAETGEAPSGAAADGSTAEGTADGAPADGAADGAASTSVSSAGLININLASRDELKSLSGIGDVKADKIIEYRQKSRFRKKEDIKKVEGIGDAIYNSIKDLITV